MRCGRPPMTRRGDELCCGPSIRPFIWSSATVSIGTGARGNAARGGFLAAALADLKAETGSTCRSPYENEFALFGEDIRWAAPFSLDAVRRIAPFADLCVAALTTPASLSRPSSRSYGVGQFEITCGPAAGLAGADRLVLTREVVHEAARQCGLRATFSPKPAPDAVGNGCHLHMSFWDADGNAAAYDADSPGELSAVAASFVAGVQRHVAALCALTAPSPISYLRLGPHHWSCGYDVVGVQNREAAIRICPSPAPDPADRGDAFNIEFRFNRCHREPLPRHRRHRARGTAGNTRQAATPDHGERGAGRFERRRKKEALGIGRLPASLEKALDVFETDESVKSWFTPTMVQAYTALNGTKCGSTQSRDPSAMCERYVQVY